MRFNLGVVDEGGLRRISDIIKIDNLERKMELRVPLVSNYVRYYIVLWGFVK